MRNLLFWEVDEPNDLTRSIDAFTFEMLPYFTNVFDRGEHKDFFVAALPLFSDRFPTASSEQKRVCSSSAIALDPFEVIRTTAVCQGTHLPRRHDLTWR